ncbi:MAG TPA: hypothetical protein VMG12_01310 [Polyangiaceae bacterium]|nr:hypothetical protein [Polyangiaceae bacterium]
MNVRRRAVARGVPAVLIVAVGGACSGAAPAAPAASVMAASAPIQFEFPPVGDEPVISSATMHGRVTALVFITTFDLASQLAARRLGEVLVSFTPRANAAAVVIEAPVYADLLPSYRSALALPYPVVMADFATQRGTGPFGSITHVPTLVILDREGREVSRHEGSLDADQIKGALRRASAR